MSWEADWSIISTELFFLCIENQPMTVKSSSFMIISFMIIIIQTILSICVNQKVNKDKRVVTVLKMLTFKFSRVIFDVILILSIFVTRSSNLQFPHPCTILHLLVPGREKSQKFQEVETDTMHKSGMVRARGDFFLPKLAGFVYKVRLVSKESFQFSRITSSDEN